MISAGVLDIESSRRLDNDAAAALGRWGGLVQELPLLARRSDHAQALRRLVDWYARVVADGSFAGEPPLDGLDALVDELTGGSSGNVFSQLSSARWAILVCEELVRLRARRTVSLSPSQAGVAVARLELALTAASRQLDQGATLASAAHPSGASI